MKPKVSVIVPVYNAERTLTACLDSLSSLSKDSPSHEIMIVDNGSQDSSMEIIQRYPQVHFIKEHEVRGPSAARNKGARAATGEILAFTDSDCIVSEKWLIQASSMLEQDGVCGVGGKIEGAPAKNYIQKWMNHRKILDQEAALANSFMPFAQTANAFFYRKDFLDVEGFDPAIPLGEDCDLCWRVLKKTGKKFVYAPESLVLHDHRCTLYGLFKQSSKNAKAACYLSKKWEGSFPQKKWKTSVWECYDLVRSIFRYLKSLCLFASKDKRNDLFLDVLHRLGRKWGMISSAYRTKQWSRW